MCAPGHDVDPRQFPSPQLEVLRPELERLEYYHCLIRRALEQIDEVERGLDPPVRERRRLGIDRAELDVVTLWARREDARFIAIPCGRYILREILESARRLLTHCPSPPDVRRRMEQLHQGLTVACTRATRRSGPLCDVRPELDDAHLDEGALTVIVAPHGLLDHLEAVVRCAIAASDANRLQRLGQTPQE